MFWYFYDFSHTSLQFSKLLKPNSILTQYLIYRFEFQSTCSYLRSKFNTKSVPALLLVAYSHPTSYIHHHLRGLHLNNISRKLARSSYIWGTQLWQVIIWTKTAICHASNVRSLSQGVWCSSSLWFSALRLPSLAYLRGPCECPLLCHEEYRHLSIRFVQM